MTTRTSIPFPNGIADYSENHGNDKPNTVDSTVFHELAVDNWPWELSTWRPTKERWTIESSADGPPKVGSIEDLNRDQSAVCSVFPAGLTTKDLFEVLRQRVNTLHQNWKSELILRRGQTQDGRFSLFTLFEKGLLSLQEFYRGNPPRTFEDTFALMHIVYSCASMYHKQDETPFWHAFFLDVLQWRYAITTQEDTMLFLEVAFRLWSVPECSKDETIACSNDFLSKLYCGHSQQSESQAHMFHILDMLEMIRLRDMLKEGRVISLCTRYLDDFDCAKIRARNAVEIVQPLWKSKPPLETTQSMEICIIDKLLRWDRVGDFYAQVIEARSDLHCGLLRNPREVEVKLAADGRSSTVYNEYRKLVHSLCNDAMFSSTPSWSDRYYATYLDELLSLLYELQKKQPSVSLDDQQYELPFMNSSQSVNYTDSHATTLTDFASFGSPDSSCNNSNTTLANSTSSNSPVELSSPASRITSYCSMCNKSFSTMTDQDNRSSLKRHMRAAHTTYMVSCPEPGCDKKFKSSDNVLRHRRKSHVGAVDVSSESFAKRKKTTDTGS